MTWQTLGVMQPSRHTPESKCIADQISTSNEDVLLPIRRLQLLHGRNQGSLQHWGPDHLCWVHQRLQTVVEDIIVFTLLTILLAQEMQNLCKHFGLEGQRALCKQAGFSSENQPGCAGAPKIVIARPTGCNAPPGWLLLS